MNATHRWWRAHCRAGKTEKMVLPVSDEIDALLVRSERLDDEAARPLLKRIIELAMPGTEVWSHATRELARRILEKEPWGASVLVKRVLEHDPEDHLAWGVLGLAQSLLGNHEYAVGSYERALRLAPENPWYLHNLGHLYDALLDRPGVAIPLLRRSLIRLPNDPHVLASLAHALARVGLEEEARNVMLRVMRGPAIDEHHALYRWLLDLSERAVALHLERQLPSASERRTARKSRRTLG